MKLEKKLLWITALIFFAIGAAVLILRGSSYTLRVLVYAEDAGQYRITIQQDKEVIQITDRNLDHGMLVLDIRAVAPGKAYLEVAESENYGFLEVIYVHRLGIISGMHIMGHGDSFHPGSQKDTVL